MGHYFCRLMLREARAEARRHRITVPRNLRASKLGGFRDHYTVTGDDEFFDEVTADCAWHAKAQVIGTLVDGSGR